MRQSQLNWKLKQRLIPGLPYLQTEWHCTPSQAARQADFVIWPVWSLLLFVWKYKCNMTHWVAQYGTNGNPLQGKTFWNHKPNTGGLSQTAVIWFSAQGAYLLLVPHRRVLIRDKVLTCIAFLLLVPQGRELIQVKVLTCIAFLRNNQPNVQNKTSIWYIQSGEGNAYSTGGAYQKEGAILNYYRD